MSDALAKLFVLLCTVTQQSAHEFLESLHAAYEKWGKLTEKQEAALDKFWCNRDKKKIKKMGLVDFD